MNDSDARLRFFADCCKMRESTAVVEVGCNFKDVGWCIRNKYLFLLDRLRKEKKEKLHDYELQVIAVYVTSLRDFMKAQQDIEEQWENWVYGLGVGFFKGRHPLLEDVDFMINPSKVSSLVEDISSDEQKKLGHLDVKYVLIFFLLLVEFEISGF
ncbi:hypothetical protein C5167_027550 [Papaver somniferum]|nr:hypothetical protein C5167_027550 [Papaver somniferum]